MRADRLLAMLMLLQTHDRLTADALAEELEVSVRTVYRDVTALSCAGIPIITDRGPGGGIALLGDYRTTLTGLTDDEIRALFLASSPAPLADLGLGGELKAALRKLTAALPDARRAEEVKTRGRIHLDAVGWEQLAGPTPHLPLMQHAIWHDQRLTLTYRLLFGTVVTHAVAPYGLVAKAGVWHLVYERAGALVVREAADVQAVVLEAQTFDRPPDFDLAAFWAEWCARRAQNRRSYPVLVRVSPELLEWLPVVFGGGLQDAMAAAGPPDAAGWVTVTLPFETFAEARTKVLGLGRACEVLEPEALRCSVADFARQVVGLYGDG